MSGRDDGSEIGADGRGDSRSQARAVGVASLIWAVTILLSRVIGLVREFVIGRTLGASRQADLYFASFTIPDFLNYLLAAGALSIVFIPIFLAHMRRGDRNGAWRAFSVVANFVLLAGGLGVIALMIFAKPLAVLVAPGFTDPAEIAELVHLTRIILPAQIFLIVGGLLSAALQAQDKHVAPALAPLIYSGGIVAGGLVGAYVPNIGAAGFAWGVLAGAFVGPFALPLFFCWRAKMRWSPTLSFRDPDLKRYLWLSAPIMVGFSIVVVDEWIVKNQASYLGAGVLSYLQYGRTLMKVPIGMFGMAAGVASYPTISRLTEAGDVAGAYDLLSRAIRMVLAAIFAAQVCMTIAGFEGVYVIWGLFSGRFTAADAQATANVLGFLCLGLGGWAAQTLISRGFYALGSTWLPTTVGTAIAIVMAPLYVGLRMIFGADGLAVASSVAIIAYIFVLGWLQRRRFEREAAARGQQLSNEHGMLDGALRMGLAALVATGVGLLARLGLLALAPGVQPVALVGRALTLGVVGLAAYAGLAHALGVREIGMLWSMAARRLRAR